MTNITRRKFIKLMGITGISLLGLSGCSSDNKQVELSLEEKISLALANGYTRREIIEIYLNDNKNIDDDIRDIIRSLYPILETCDENYFIFAIKQISLIMVNYESVGLKPNNYTKVVCTSPCDITYYKENGEKINADYIFPEICSWLAITIPIKKEVTEHLHHYTKGELAVLYLSKNPFLSSTEKEMIKPIISFLENHTNDEEFARAMASLNYMRIVYEPYDKQVTVKSMCDSPFRIYYFGEEESISNYDILKETFNAICFSSSYNYLGGMSKLLAREYLGERDSNAYGDPCKIIRILCEIIDSDIVLTCYLNNDLTLLKASLLNINNDETKADNFLYIIKGLLSNREYDNILKEFKTQCISYFNDKYGYKASDDFIMKDYLSLFKTSEDKYKISKTYFNEEEMPNDIVYDENGEIYNLDKVTVRTRYTSLKQNKIL